MPDGSADIPDNSVSQPGLIAQTAVCVTECVNLSSQRVRSHVYTCGEILSYSHVWMCERILLSLCVCTCVRVLDKT